MRTRAHVTARVELERILKDRLDRAQHHRRRVGQLLEQRARRRSEVTPVGRRAHLGDEGGGRRDEHLHAEGDAGGGGAEQTVGKVLGASAGCHTPGSKIAASSVRCSSRWARAAVRAGSAKKRSSKGTRR